MQVKRWSGCFHGFFCAGSLTLFSWRLSRQDLFVDAAAYPDLGGRGRRGALLPQLPCPAAHL